MHRLPRQIASSTRLLRTRKALDRHSLPFSHPRRHYVSPKLRTLPQSLAIGRYAEIYRLLTPDLKQEEAAKIGAALIKSAQNDLQLERAQLVLETNYPHLDQDALQAEVTRLLDSGATLDSLLGGTKTTQKSSVKSKSAAESRTSRSNAKTSGEAVEQSPAGSSALHHSPRTFKASNKLEFAQAFESQEAQQAISMLTREEMEKFDELEVAFKNSIHYTNVTAMRGIAKLLGQYGFNLEITAQEDSIDRKDSPAKETPRPEGALEIDSATQKRVMTDEEADLATRRAIAKANPLAQTEEEEEQNPYPNLMSYDPLMDSRDVLDLPPTPEHPYHNRVTVRNHSSMFHEAMALDGFNFDDPNWQPEKTDLGEDEMSQNESAGLSPSVRTGPFYRFPLLTRFTTQQTGKGKIKHYQVFTVMGDGNGMVGLGIGVDEETEVAYRKAETDALRNMDYVDRFEKRTIWTDMRHKFRSTQIIMRPRPTGFGLRCGPIMHQVLKAAGIKDISGKIWGSRNPVMIMQGLMKMLHGGHAPLGMGNGIGGKGKRLTKGSGMRTQFDVERDRGRKLVNLRK
ncbi:28S ribosomal protein S5, mitochondrial [Marasmius crinis-equi]|uniref:28S ribosomal protein S5, mitochondrial n=1 Tax=Marasmius crinis-equi TaxID=585013 RepID=A0ABR3FGG3_9AGAR